MKCSSCGTHRAAEDQDWDPERDDLVLGWYVDAGEPLCPVCLAAAIRSGLVVL